MTRLKIIFSIISTCILFACTHRSEEQAEKIRILLDSAYSWRYDPNSRCVAFSDSAKRLAIRNKLTSEEIRSYNILSSYYYFAGFPDSVKKYANFALRMAEKSNDLSNLAMAKRCLSNWYLMTNDYNEAIKLEKQASQIFLHINDRKNAAISFNNAAVVYEYAEKYDSSIIFYNKAIAINTKNSFLDELPYNYCGLGDCFRETGLIDSAIRYFEKANTIFKNQHSAHGEMTISISLTDLYNEQSKFEEALEYANISLEISQKKGLKRQEAVSLQRLGITYKRMGEYALSIENYEKAHKILLEIDDKNGYYSVISDIAQVYFNWGKYDKSLMYHLQALHFQELINKKGNANLYNSISSSYMKLNKYDSAMHYSNLGLRYALESNNLSAVSIAYSNLGLIQGHVGNNKKAIEYFLKGIEIDKNLSNRYAEACGYSDIANLYYGSDHNKAAEYKQKALEIARHSGLKAMEAELIDEIAKLYELKKDFEKAYRFKKKSFELNQEILDEKATAQMANFEAKNKVYRKSQELEKAQLENKLNLEKLHGANNFKLFILFVLCLSIIFMFALYHRFLKLRMAHRELVKKNVELSKLETVQMKFPMHILLDDGLVDKYAKSNISQSQTEEILEKLNYSIKSEKVFLDSELTLNKLAKKLNTNSAYLSQVINDTYNQNFNNYINEFRIREARQMLSSNESSNYTLEWVARRVGFNSKSAFNTAFKKFTGVTPSFYYKTLQERIPA